MIKVYHVKEPTFWVSSITKMENLHPVAEVETDSLDEVYELTNTIHQRWIDNDGVKFLGCHRHGMSGCRSTSIGDILEKDGKFYMVDHVGFKEVNLS